jgi:hypothetical protein
MNCRHGRLITPTFKVLLEGRGFFYVPEPSGEPRSRGFFIATTHRRDARSSRADGQNSRGDGLRAPAFWTRVIMIRPNVLKNATLLMQDLAIENWPPMFTLVVGASIMALLPVGWSIIGLIEDFLRAPPRPAAIAGAGRRITGPLFDPDCTRKHGKLRPRSAALREGKAANHRTVGGRASRPGGDR